MLIIDAMYSPIYQTSIASNLEGIRAFQDGNSCLDRMDITTAGFPLKKFKSMPKVVFAANLGSPEHVP